MLESGFDRVRIAGALGLLFLLPLGAGAQLRTVVSNEIAVSGGEATLRLDFKDDGGLTIAFEDGQVTVDGDVVGSYVRADALDSAWRSLLGEVLSLDDGPLAQALLDWAPPGSVTGVSGEVAALLDQALEDALALPEEGLESSAQGEITVGIPGEGTLLGALLLRTGALEALADALEGLSLAQAGIRVGENVVVAAGEEWDGTLIIVDGDLELLGTIHGDVVLAQGSVLLREGGRITGDLRVAHGEVEWLGGSVDGSLIDLDAGDRPRVAEPDLESLRKELEKDIRRELLSTVERERSSGKGTSFLSPFRNVGMALAGLMENLVSFLVLGVLGILAVHFARENLDVVATTARRAPARSAVVGLAGGFLLIPVWILGMVALGISIIGIPVLIVWVPLFPIAAGMAALLGYLAVAKNVGEWVAEQRYRGLEWIRGSNAFYTVLAGVGALMVPCVASSLARLLGIGFLQGLLVFAGSMVTLVAAAIGFGAVLLTRGGRIRPDADYYEFEEDGWAEESYPPPEGEGKGAEGEPEGGEEEGDGAGEETPGERESGPEPPTEETQ
jgi:hypothetical protein